MAPWRWEGAERLKKGASAAWPGGMGRLPWSAALFILLSVPAHAQEIAGGECQVGAGVAGQFDVGWFHNQPETTRRQDGYWADAPGGTLVYWDTPRDASPLGADDSVVANYAPDEIVGSGLIPSTDPIPTTRYLYAGVGGAGSTLTQAVSGNDYLQYQFTTPASLSPRTFFKRTGFGAWDSERYQYAVRVSTDPGFATYWTVIQDQTVAGAGVDTYNYRAADTTRFPLLRPSTTYYVRAYLYNRTINTGAVPNSIAADDFQLGTGLCPLPVVTVTKISSGGVGSFDFTGTNGFANQAIVTTSAGTGVTGAARVLSATNTATTIAETAPTGFALTDIACSGLPAGTPTYTVNGAQGAAWRFRLRP
ncbi:MAG: hypothetical protein HOQ32_06315 [Lysobacter sp.]|nr:hypothetical protein [Lysobacter sp.]